MKPIYKVLMAIYQFFIAALLASIAVSLLSVKTYSESDRQPYTIFGVLFLIAAFIFIIFSFGSGQEASKLFYKDSKQEKEQETPKT